MCAKWENHEKDMDIITEGSFSEHKRFRPSLSWARNFCDSFKPVSLEYIDTVGLPQHELAAILTANQPLKRDLTARMVNGIALGGAIGTGLFVGSGQCLQTGGPAAVVLSFSLVGIVLFCTMNALGELAVRYPVLGSFAVYSTRFQDPSWGFAMGWNYALQWLVTFPVELIACAMIIDFWWLDSNGALKVNKAAWIAVFYFFIALANVFGVRGYGETEFVLTLIKCMAMIGFCIFGVIVAAGGPPTYHYYGAHYWHDPGAFVNGFKGVVNVFLTAAFAFGGTELSGLAAAETTNPVKTLPRAIKQVFWRVLLFYVVSLTIVSMLVPYTDKRLTGDGDYDGRSSPFVIAIQNTGVKGLPSVFNVVILLAVLSVANSAVYACSRTLAAMAVYGQAPRILSYVDRSGRPLVSTIVTLLFGLMAFLVVTPKCREIFDWLIAFSGLSSIFTWFSINVSHIRFRAALKRQGRSVDELAYRSLCGVLGSYIGALTNVLIIGVQFWVALFPINKPSNAADFFKAFLSLPVVVIFYLVHKLMYGGPLYIRSNMINLDDGMRDLPMEQVLAELAEEKEKLRHRNCVYRVYRFWC